MPRAEQSIVIQGDLHAIFTITNDIARWPELFAEYRGARILSEEQEGRFTKLVFELTNEQGQQWRSWRILDFKEHTAIAQRQDPMFPFKYMHLTWLYVPLDDGKVKMTWIQDFEMDPAAPVNNEQALGYMLKHMTENQEHFKKILETQINSHVNIS